MIQSQITHARVTGGGHAFRMSGKPEAFSDEENAVLRAEFRRLREQYKWSQTEAGRQIGIAQQNAGRLLGANPESGMSRTTANRLARLCGFRDAEDLLLHKGVLAEMQPLPGGARWRDRDIAVRIARHIGYDAGVIEAVVARYTGAEHQHKSMKWWNVKIVLEQMTRAAEGEERTYVVEPERPLLVADTAGAAAPPLKPRRKSG